MFIHRYRGNSQEEERIRLFALKKFIPNADPPQEVTGADDRQEPWLSKDLVTLWYRNHPQGLYAHGF